METKFTPGPWMVGNGAKVYCDDATGSIVAQADNFSLVHREADEEKANSHLIASAPELYAALDAMIDLHIKDFGVAGLSGNPTIDRACAALAKARGEK